jgi:hypothetical protein
MSRLGGLKSRVRALNAIRIFQFIARVDGLVHKFAELGESRCERLDMIVSVVCIDIVFSEPVTLHHKTRCPIGQLSSALPRGRSLKL